MLIVVDTLRADHLGCYGYDEPTSPHLDARAADGVLFTRAYATSPWTFPSMASIVTSLYPETHGAYLPGEMRRITAKSTPNRLSRKFTTLAEVLEESGITTASISANVLLGYGVQQGFAEYHSKRQNAGLQTRKAREWLETVQEGERFFLLLHFIDVHEPNAPPGPPSPALRACAGADPEGGRVPTAGSAPTGTHPRAGSTRASSPSSAVASRCTTRRSTTSTCRSTVSSSTSCGSTPTPRSSSPPITARSSGITPSWRTGSTRIPAGSTASITGTRCSRRWCGSRWWCSGRDRIPPRVVDEPASLVDLMPTILELMDVPYDGPTQGVSLLGAMLGESVPPRPLYFGETCFGRNKHGVLDGDTKLILSDREPVVAGSTSRGEPEEQRGPLGGAFRRTRQAASLDRRHARELTLAVEADPRRRAHAGTDRARAGSARPSARSRLHRLTANRESGSAWPPVLR